MENQTIGNAIDPVQFLFDAAEKMGLGAQAHQFVTVVLACLSATAGTIFHIHLAGPFSSGKSTVTRGVRTLLGSKYIVSSGAIQRLTPAAAARMNLRLMRKGLILDERAVDRELEALLRVTAAGDVAVRTITIKGQAVDLEIQPRFSIIEVMLDEKDLSRQDRSRYLRLRMPVDRDSRDHISALSRQRHTLAGLLRESAADSLAASFQAYLTELVTDTRVVVPFANLIRMDTPSQIRDRLVNQIIAATRTVAWLRQQHREIRDIEGIGSVLFATPADYEVIYSIVVAVGDDGQDEEIGDNAIKLLRIWARWARQNDNGGLRRTDIEQIAADELSIWQTYRALRELAKAEYASGPSGSGRSGDWRLTDIGIAAERPNLFHSLPTPDEIAEALQDSKVSPDTELAKRDVQSCAVAPHGGHSNG